MSHPVTDWTRLHRFLMFGSESPTYSPAAPPLALEHATSVQRAIALDGPRVVRTAMDTRAPNSEPALFVLAAAASLGSTGTRTLALAALPQLARTAAELFRFAAFVDAMRGWGRGLRRAIANWYLEMPVEQLAYQVANYSGGDGWSHCDLLRLAHPKADGARDALFRWVISGDFDEKRPAELESSELRLIYAVEEIRQAASASDAARIVASYGLTARMVPDRFLDSVEVWSALLERMPFEAMLRHLGVMTSVGLLESASDAVRLVVSRLGNEWAIGRAGLHPLQVLAARLTYQSGRQPGGRHTWTPLKAVLKALDSAFDLSFANVPRTGKRFNLALDVSGSMDRGEIAGVPALTPRVAAAAMTMITARAERESNIGAFSYGMTPLEVTASDSLPAVGSKTGRLTSGRTDCALPILDATARGIETDVFVVLTDSGPSVETTHPVQALRRYRDRTGIAAKLVVVGMLSNGFSIADPDDAGTLDVIGFDTATPNLIAHFAAA